jgi:hypothetical protein
MAVAVVSIICTPRVSSVSVLFSVFFLLLESLDHLVICGFSQILILDGTILVCLLHSRLNILPRVSYTHRRFKMLDA